METHEEEIRVAGWYPLEDDPNSYQFWDGFNWSHELRLSIEKTSHERRIANRYGYPPISIWAAWLYMVILGVIAIIEMSRLI